MMVGIYQQFQGKESIRIHMNLGGKHDLGSAIAAVLMAHCISHVRHTQ